MSGNLNTKLLHVVSIDDEFSEGIGDRCSEHRLVAAEAKFFHKVKRSGKYQVTRSGWPDFFLYNPATKRHFCVEVKSRHDRIRAKQYKMFAALEQIGLHTYIWRPDFGDELVHWCKYKNPPTSKFLKRLINQRK